MLGISPNLAADVSGEEALQLSRPAVSHRVSWCSRLVESLDIRKGLASSVGWVWSGVSSGFSWIFPPYEPTPEAKRALWLLPLEERCSWNVLWNLDSIFLKLPLPRRPEYLALIENMPVGERAGFVRTASRLVLDMPSELAGEGILDTFVALPKEDRSEGVLHALLELFERLPSGHELAAAALQWSLRRDRAELIEFGAEFTRFTSNPCQLEAFLVGVLFAAPEDREFYLELCLSRVEVGVSPEQLLLILTESPRLFVHAYDFLLRSLEELTDPKEARNFSSIILRAAKDVFGLHDEHPLYQKALVVHTLSAPERMERVNNPYRVYKQLKRWQERGPVPIVGKPEKVTGKWVQWDIEGIRELAQPIQYTQSDLAEGVELEDSSGEQTDIFEEVFSQLQGRLSLLRRHAPKEELDRIIAIGKFLDNPTVQTLLDPLEEEVSPYTYHLYRVGGVLAQADPVLREGRLFTEQEEMLMAIAASVQYCSAGVREAICIYSNNLSGSKEAVASDREEKIDLFLAEILHKLMSNQFANLAFLHALGQEVQEHHGSLFAKNLLSRQVGYPHHTLQFDLHTGVLEQEFVRCGENSASVRRAATAYFAHFPVLSLLEQVQKLVNADWQREPAEQNIGLTALAFYLARRKSESTRPLFERGYIVDRSEKEDYSGPFAMTEAGALAFVECAGLVRA